MSEKNKDIQNNGNENAEKEQQANQITKEQLRQLKMMFDYFDTDKSGSLDTEELKKLVVMIMGSQGSQEERLDLLAQVDQDGNGSVQYHQFQQLFKKKLMKTNFRKQMQAAFKLIDISESSYITYQQLYLICNQLNMNFQPSEIKRMIEIGSQADPGPNGQKQKGKVFLQQFIQMMSEN